MRTLAIAALALGVLGCSAEHRSAAGTGEAPAAASSASGAGGERGHHEPLDPAAQERIAANQQGRPSPPGTVGEGSASAPSEADVLGRSGYGGAGGGASGGVPVIGGDREHPVPTCGPEESYLFVARDFRCPGGGANPLGGDPAAGAAARRGNVGAHSFTGPRTGDPMLDAHIVDVYEVPCPGGPVEVFVCMYHCPMGAGPIRAQRTSTERTGTERTGTRSSH